MEGPNLWKFVHEAKLQFVKISRLRCWSRNCNSQLGPAKKSSQNLILKLLGMLAIPQFKARFQAWKQF